jgi:hypothetical protein
MSVRKIATVSNGARVCTVYFDSEYREYQIRLAIGGEKKPYATGYTDDKQDAMGTAKAMAFQTGSMAIQQVD